MQESDFQQEQKWLDFVYRQIDKQLAQQERQTRGSRGQVLEMRASLWEEERVSGASLNRMMDIAQQIAELRHSATQLGLQLRLLEQLQTAQKAPYFGRMDFHEEGFPTAEAMYIGIRSLVDQGTNLPLVYDWRAPVSSMFYDYGLGKAQYEGPGGIYRGEISLKRQYRIKDRKLVYMFDNELKIDDEILQRALGQHADDKMRVIVNTIQREQNQAIRNDQDDFLLVEGPAGSGKTSVALHRVAYLLYKYRESIRSQNIVIFSPNRIFSDYISHVLPELGEENVFQTTFQDFSEPFLGWHWDLETQLVYLENLFSKAGEERATCLRTMAFKSSPAFQGMLDNLIEVIIEEACEFFDVPLGQQLIISAEEQRKLFTENYSYLPAHKRLRKIYQRIMFLLRPIKKRHLRKVFKEIANLPAFEDESWWAVAREAVKRVHDELDPILDKLRSDLEIDYVDWYVRFWRDPILRQRVTGNLWLEEHGAGSLKSLETKTISFEDVVPLLYLKGELEGYPVRREIQHVVVDEVQDYAPIQLGILAKTFPRARFTFVGDVFQSLNPYVWQAAETRLEDLFGKLGLKAMRLNKSYRSTEEIFRFCSGLLAAKSHAEAVLRHGNKPLIQKVSKEQHTQGLADLITRAMQANYETIAVICLTVEESRTIYDSLQQCDPELEVSLLVQEKAKFKSGILVVPVFLAKGLEFDAVILPQANSETYSQDYQRRLLYVACSRALHSLTLMYSDHLSPFVQALPRGLYRLE